MKKLFIFAVFAVLLGSFITLNSCKKLLKYDLPLRAGYVVVSIPPGDSMTQVFGAASSSVNIDSVVKEGTGRLFGFKNITSAKLTKVTMYLATSNDSNNFANFKNVIATFSTNSGSTFSSVYQIGLFNNPDSYSTIENIPVTTDELKSYLVGNQFNFTCGGLLRRRTTDTLRCTIEIEFNLHIN